MIYFSSVLLSYYVKGNPLISFLLLVPPLSIPSGCFVCHSYMYLIVRLFVCFSVCLFLFFSLFVMIFSCFVFYRWFIDSERPSMYRQVTSSKLSNDFLKSNVYSRPSFSLFSYKDDLQVYMRQTFSDWSTEMLLFQRYDIDQLPIRDVIVR